MDEVYLDTRNWNKWCKERFPYNDFISLDDLMSDYEDMIDEIENLKDKIRDMERDVEDNYEPIPVNRQYEVYDTDFI